MAPAPTPMDSQTTLAQYGPSSEAPVQEAPPLPEPAPAKPYSSFTTWQKRFIVFIASGAGLFSSLSAQIYFPALNTLAEELNVTPSMINLTVTSYMVSANPSMPTPWPRGHGEKGPHN